MANTKVRTDRVWRGRLEDSKEGRKLLANPAFKAALEKGRASGPGAGKEELRRELGITEEDLSAADAEIDRLLAEDAKPVR